MTNEFSPIELAGRALYGDRWQAPIARDLGVSTTAVQDWKNGKSTPRPGVFRDLLPLLQRRMDDVRAAIEAVQPEAEKYREPKPLGYYEIWWRENDGKLSRPHRGQADGIGITYRFTELQHAREAIRHAYDVRAAQAAKRAYPALREYDTPSGIPAARSGRLGIKRVVGGVPVEEIE